MSAGTLNRECTVRVGPLVNIPRLLSSLGCNPEPIFERCGLTVAEFESIEHRVSYQQGGRLFTECVAATGCDHFGLLLGQMATVSHIGIPGFLIRTAPSVKVALEALVSNLDLHDEGGTCSLNIEGNYSRLCFYVHQPGLSATAQICDLASVVMCKIMRLLCGSAWNPVQVMVARSRPQNVKPFSRYYRSQILFDSENCGIVFFSSDLAVKPPLADEILYNHLELEADMQHHMKQSDFLDMLPVVIQKSLLQHHSSAADIADAFGLHERTLHRRLKSAGTSFRQELDKVRESLSTQLLQNTSMPIYDIAVTLGYADSSGFIRAFHRWTSVSPACWRKQHA